MKTEQFFLCRFRTSDAHPFFVFFLILFLLCGSAESWPRDYQVPSSSEYNNQSDTKEKESAGQTPAKTGLLSLSFRACFSSSDVIGDVTTEEFREYDVAANFRSPWRWYAPSGWGADIRLSSGIGVLDGAGETALIVSLIPLLAVGSQDGKFTLDMGAGGVFLSRHHFGTQDFGGPFQFALTAGISFPLFSRFGAGYRYLHYSDAAIYGPHTIGVDFHMLELIYRF